MRVRKAQGDVLGSLGAPLQGVSEPSGVGRTAVWLVRESRLAPILNGNPFTVLSRTEEGFSVQPIDTVIDFRCRAFAGTGAISRAAGGVTGPQNAGHEDFSCSFPDSSGILGTVNVVRA